MDESERDLDSETREMAHKAFRRAVGLARTQTAFAARVGSSQQNISKLLKLRRLLPRDLAIATEREFGVPCHETRPDLFPIENSPGEASPPCGDAFGYAHDPLQGLRS
ncbi:MAG: hypothetical protein WCY29_16015 [Novosphingobium sp.]